MPGVPVFRQRRIVGTISGFSGDAMLALLLLGGAALTACAWLLLRRRRAPAPPSQSGEKRDRDVPPSVATPPAIVVPDPSETLDGLKAKLAAASNRLWAGALSNGKFEIKVPPEHVPVVAAARTALLADPLSERYFPRRPLLMPQLLAAVNDPDAPPLKLAEIIGQDPVLTGNILRLANSVFFRLSAKPVESIQTAVVVCGTDGLQSLAATALIQPVFRGSGAAHSRFPVVLWERCTQASIAAELCARKWCPADRQAAQLLALLSALGPLVAYRVVDDQYRAHAELTPAPAVFLRVIDRYGVALAARIAQLWQSPPRIVATLRGKPLPDATGDPEPAAQQAGSPLERALHAGELLATLSLLAAEGQMNDGECGAYALTAGIPMPLFATVWARLHPVTEQDHGATQVA